MQCCLMDLPETSLEIPARCNKSITDVKQRVEAMCQMDVVPFLGYII